MSHTEKCPLCGGVKQAGYTTYSTDLEFGVVVVRKVPALICKQCGEEWISNDTAKHLEKIVVQARTQRREVEVLQYELAK